MVTLHASYDFKSLFPLHHLAGISKEIPGVPASAILAPFPEPASRARIASSFAPGGQPERLAGAGGGLGHLQAGDLAG
jgi:hypothetical protein